jgi:hypothetical protein
VVDQGGTSRDQGGTSRDQGSTSQDQGSTSRDQGSTSHQLHHCTARTQTQHSVPSILYSTGVQSVYSARRSPSPQSLQGITPQYSCGGACASPPLQDGHRGTLSSRGGLFGCTSQSAMCENSGARSVFGVAAEAVVWADLGCAQHHQAARVLAACMEQPQLDYTACSRTRLEFKHKELI